MWNTPPSTFRGRRLLVIESLFIHHPNATLIMLSPTLNDTQLFLPFRQRGYRIYSFNVSLDHLLYWKWYLDGKTKDFLRHWNSSGVNFYTHFTDYYRTIALYIYGGTYMDMDALVLQPFPRNEFIGLDQTEMGNDCPICIPNTPGVYLAPGVMRFRPRRTVLRRILEQTFTRKAYDPSCFNCVGPKPYTYHITQAQQNDDSELADLQLLEPHRLYPFMWTQTSLIFHRVQADRSLELADLMKRSYSLHLFGHVSDELSVARGSIIDFLFDRFDLGDLRSNAFARQSNTNVQFIHPSFYIYHHRKQGRFIGRDVIYFRLNHTLAHSHSRWNITIQTYNGTVVLPSHTPQWDLNQAQINLVLHHMSYTPFPSTSIDTLVIVVKSEDVIVNCSMPILVFSQWVTVLTKTMGTPNRWPVLQRLVASVERYYPQTTVHIASDSGKTIDVDSLFNFTANDGMVGDEIKKNAIVHDLPEDSGLSSSRNYLVKATKTPFFFLLDDDFELQEDSHLDLLLETIYTYPHIDIIAGKIPEDMSIYYDYAGVFLHFNQTIELILQVPDHRKNQILYPQRSSKELNIGNPCRQVDFVPNVFMGRTDTVQLVPWDDELKLGEHEDFFIRFGQANRTVYTCDYIKVHHIQVHWWLQHDHPYYQKRARVFNYVKKMLKKHNCRRLISFGITNAELAEES